MGFCEAIYISAFQTEYCSFAIMCVVYPTMLLLYVRICNHIRRITNPSQHDQDNLRSSINSRQQTMHHRNRKAVGTTFLILGTFSLCWLPNFLFQTTTSIYTELIQPNVLSTHIVDILRYFDKIFIILLLVNCCADPLIYSFRLREIQMGYKVVFRCGKRWKRLSSRLSTSSRQATVFV